MSRAARCAATSALEVGANDPISGWRLPVIPRQLRVYDKYTGRQESIDTSKPDWGVPAGGVTHRLAFAEGQVGAVQKVLVLTAAGSRAPQTLVTVAKTVTKQWSRLAEMLVQGPLAVKSSWNPADWKRGEAAGVRQVLAAACNASLGAWTPAHLALVKALRSQEKSSYKNMARKVARREVGVPVDVQAAVARVLDRAVATPDLSELHLEGLVALALAFQHGVRPVEALVLEVGHVTLYRDAAGAPGALLAFHVAKQEPGDPTLEVVRSMKPEWVPLLERLVACAKAAGRRQLFGSTSSYHLWFRVQSAAKRFDLELKHTPYAFRHAAAQALADAGHSRASIRRFLGHTSDISANAYVSASLSQAKLINEALGVSKLYNAVLKLSEGGFVSLEELAAADEDRQVGAVVGTRLVAGVGLCSTGQSSCSYNPVTSCYGCEKFMPSLDRASHEEAIAGMREQVVLFMRTGINADAPAYRQLTSALAGAQTALDAIDKLSGDNA